MKFKYGFDKCFKSSISCMLITFLLNGCSKPSENNTASTVKYYNFPVVKTFLKAVNGKISWVGTVESSQPINIAPQIQEVVKTITVAEGSVIQPGMLLVALNDDVIIHEVKEIESQIEEAASSIEQAKHSIESAKLAIEAKSADLALKQKRYKRIDDLHKLNSATDDEFDTAATQLQLAKVAFAEANNNLSLAQDKLHENTIAMQTLKQSLAKSKVKFAYTKILSPVKGIVTGKKINVGDLVAPGQTILTIEKPEYKLICSIPEDDLNLFVKNSPVMAKINGLPGEITNLTIDEIVPNIDPKTRSFNIKIKLPSIPEIKSGMYGKAIFLTKTANKVLLPQTAIVNQGQLSGVYVVSNDGQIDFRIISLGQKNDNSYEVISGIKANETVINGDFDKITQDVRVKN